MTRNDMHDDERPDDTYDVNEENPPHGIMQVLKDKVGLGVVALILLIIVIVFLGARNKIMGYFVRTPAVVEASALPQPTDNSVMQSERVIPAIDNQGNQVDDTVFRPVDRNVAMLPDDAQVPVINSDKSAAGYNSAAVTDRMRETIKDFIMNNPEVVIESLNKFQQKKAQAMTLESKEYISKSADTIMAGKPFIGNKDGNIVVTEFFDYKCGYCRKVYPDLLKLIKEYPNLKIVLVELPYGGDASTKAVKFSLAVNALYPEQFYNFHTALLNAPSIDDNVIYGLISQYNMDKAKLVEKANSEEIEKIISQNMQQANKAGVRGVPSFLINEEFVQGAASYSEFKKKLDIINKS